MNPSGKGAAVTLKGCTKTFADGTRAVGPIDLDIPAGETLVLLGPSGCGKTTLLRIIAGLERPDDGGHVRFDGEDVTATPIERRNVGMVFQSYALFPNMNVLENVAYGLRVRGIARGERHAQARDVLTMMRIDALANRRIDQLSGGQRQRVALARALAVRPRALLLDEPLTALDALLRDQLRGEIDALLRTLGITAIYVTHDQTEAMALADRIVVMREGHIAQAGPPRDIFFRPVDTFVADFVGMTNRLSGTLRDGRFETACGTVPYAGSNRAPAVLAFRADALSLAKDGASALHLKVERLQFLGVRQRVWLSAAPDISLVADLDPSAKIEPGTTVDLAVDPAAAVLV